MTGDKDGSRTNRLLAEEKWEEARALIQQELESEPMNHWLLTQLGVTYYEQKRYHDALGYFEESLKLVPDCPLTLWNLAGVLDALDRSVEAVPIYTSLLKSRMSPQSDACWESDQWADELKTDCVYRIGVCFEHLGNRDRAEWCYRRYVQLTLAGINGSYSLDGVMTRIRSIHPVAPHSADAASQLQEVVDAIMVA
jgi:tetratricopeptide (TPR) repeat protein